MDPTDAAATPTTVRVPERRPRLLVCDPRPVVRLGLRAMVGELGVVGDCAPPRLVDAMVALVPDVVVVGLPTGHLEAFAPIADATRTRPDLAVVVVTDDPSDLDVHAAAITGARGVVASDADPAELVDAVRRILAGELVVPPDEGTRVGDAGSETLRPRDLRVLELVAEGLSNADIATRLGLPPRTVKTVVAHLLERLGASDRTAAVARAFRLGLLR